MKCVLCGKEFEGFGNNAEPLATGKCCDACNERVVVARYLFLQYWESGKEKQQHFEKMLNEFHSSHPAQIGDRVLIIKMQEEPQYRGKRGIIEHIDDIGQLHGSWGGCALIPNEDVYLVIGGNDNG